MPSVRASADTADSCYRADIYSIMPQLTRDTNGGGTIVNSDPLWFSCPALQKPRDIGANIFGFHGQMTPWRMLP